MTVSISKWTAHHNQLLYSLLEHCEYYRIPLYIKYSINIPDCGVILEFKKRKVFLDYSDDYRFIENPNYYDLYFKRSLRQSDMINNVRPLNFQVNFSYKPLKLIAKLPHELLFNRGSGLELIRALDRFSIVTNDSHCSKSINNFRSRSSIVDNGGKVIYMTRLWDPYRTSDSQEKERRNLQNQFRINACRIIRKNFPNSKVGLFPDTYAKSIASDCLLNLNDTKKVNYLNYLYNSDICIADDGLKDTPGWKIGEYVMLNKAVISTPIRTVAENFHKDQNYLNLDTRKDFYSIPEKIYKLLDAKKYMNMKWENKKWSDLYLDPRAYAQNIMDKIIECE